MNPQRVASLKSFVIIETTFFTYNTHKHRYSDAAWINRIQGTINKYGPVQRERENVRIHLPETRSKPEARVFKATTRLPWNLPANKIKTVPGVMEALILVGFLTGVGPLTLTWSSAG